MRLAEDDGVRLDWDGFEPAVSGAEADFLRRQPRSSQIEDLWAQAEAEARCEELGGPFTPELVDEIEALAGRDSVLIGGPPCQAYSLVGRARNRGIDGYVPEEDHRHFLYEEYVKILERVEPVAFVMENVKGILSARVRGRGVFARIVEDLEAAGYKLCPLAPGRASGQGAMFDEADPRNFVIRSEQFGVPQARHRVIVLGIRADIVEQVEQALDGAPISGFVAQSFSGDLPIATVAEALSGLPRVRSRLSRRTDGFNTWEQAVVEQAEILRTLPEIRDVLGREDHEAFLKCVSSAARAARGGMPTSASALADAVCQLSPELATWVSGSAGHRLYNHDARGHMASDLGRYLFASAFAFVTGYSPKAEHFPERLAPNHKNWNSGKFADRFRVQVAGAPATTVTSHISKDGHYFIHPDPTQCRSLTVREAARIQTFPDDYVFLGNRTEQYVQVGNAVPPFLARRIAAVVWRVLARI